MKVYIPTCDSNAFILKYFQYFFNKYWSPDIEVKVLGFQKPNFELHQNFEFISLDERQAGGARGWSNYMIDYFSSIEDSNFVFGIEDFAIARPVDITALNACVDSISDDVGRIDLQCSMQYARHPSEVVPYQSKNGVEFLELKQDGSYRVAGAFSIWNRSWFLKNMRRDWSPWDWEMSGSKLSINDGYRVIGTKDRWSIKKIEMISDRGWPGIINTRGIRAEDVRAMKSFCSQFDRVNRLENIMDERWGYYEYCGPDWMQIIFGD